MAKDEPAGTPPRNAATEYLANERTFLAWIRTSIATVGLGFAIGKFDVWLRELGGRASGPVGPAEHWAVPIGLAMVAFGGAVALLSAWHYRRTNARIAAGRVGPNDGLVLGVAAAIAAFAAILFAYVLLNETGR